MGGSIIDPTLCQLHALEPISPIAALAVRAIETVSAHARGRGRLRVALSGLEYKAPEQTVVAAEMVIAL
jgi:hypothetical protein